MVPGMTERERLAADVRLCEWLADARLSPALTAVSPMGRVMEPSRRPRLPLRLMRSGLAMAQGVTRCIRLIAAEPARQAPDCTIAPGR